FRSLDDTGVSIFQWEETDVTERERGSTRCETPGHPSLRRRRPQRRHDMSALQHRQRDLLQVAKAISGARSGKPSRPGPPDRITARSPQRGGDRQDRLPAPELPPRALQARDVPQAPPPAGPQRVEIWRILRRNYSSVA